MAAKKDVETVEAVETAEKATTKKADSDPKYKVEKLREKSILLYGVSQSTFDGAMFGHTEEEYTIKEARDIIDGWLYGKEGKN